MVYKVNVAYSDGELESRETENRDSALETFNKSLKDTRTMYASILNTERNNLHISVHYSGTISIVNVPKEKEASPANAASERLKIGKDWTDRSTLLQFALGLV